MCISRRQILKAIAASSAISGVSSSTWAQTASKVVRLYQGFPAGGAPDTIGRLLAPGLGKGIARTVILESKVGAAERVVAQHLSRLPPDGDHLLLYTGVQAVHAALDKKISYDIIKDFTHIAGVAKYGFLICVGSNSPYVSLSDLLDDAARRPGRITYSSPGIGSTLHLAGERISTNANVKMLHVPYNNLNNYVDVVSGTLDVVIGTYSSSIGLITDGRLRALAVTSKQRLKALPNVPSVNETLPNSDLETLVAIAGPAGMPAKIVASLRAALKPIQSSPQMIGELERLGFSSYATHPGEIERELETATATVRMIAARANINVGH